MASPLCLVPILRQPTQVFRSLACLYFQPSSVCTTPLVEPLATNYVRDLETTDNAIEPLLKSLVTNLATPSHDIRSASLHILDALYCRSAGRKSNSIATALLIEES